MSQYFDVLFQQCYEITGGFRLSWPVEKVLKLGHYGTLDNNVLQITNHIGSGWTPLEYTCTEKVNKTFQITMDGHEIKFTTHNLRHFMLDDLLKLETELKTHNSQTVWNKDYKIVSELVTTDQLVIEVPESSDLAIWLNNEKWLQQSRKAKREENQPQNIQFYLREFEFVLFYRCLYLTENQVRSNKKDAGFGEDPSENFQLRVFDPFAN